MKEPQLVCALYDSGMLINVKKKTIQATQQKYFLAWHNIAFHSRMREVLFCISPS